MKVKKRMKGEEKKVICDVEIVVKE